MSVLDALPDLSDGGGDEDHRRGCGRAGAPTVELRHPAGDGRLVPGLAGGRGHRGRGAVGRRPGRRGGRQRGAGLLGRRPARRGPAGDAAARCGGSLPRAHGGRRQRDARPAGVRAGAVRARAAGRHRDPDPGRDLRVAGAAAVLRRRAAGGGGDRGDARRVRGVGLPGRDRRRHVRRRAGGSPRGGAELVRGAPAGVGPVPGRPGDQCAWRTPSWSVCCAGWGSGGWGSSRPCRPATWRPGSGGTAAGCTGCPGAPTCGWPPDAARRWS